jgi:limonene-1,2-epoxide hydrolase
MGMTIEEIAGRLVVLCRQQQYETAQKELFSQDAVSSEPFGTPDFPRETSGLDAIVEKGHRFASMVAAVHKLEVSEPIIAKSSFACTMRMDVTMKAEGHMDMTELCVYEVKDGKIVTETFYM